MTSLASERNWLFNPSTLKKIQQCRRLIQMEFGVKLHLTEESLVEQMNDYAGKSRSDTLTRTWADLRDAVPELAELASQAEVAHGGRTYRGQAVAGAGTSPVPGDDPAEVPHPRKNKVIYRGRVVG